MLAAESLFVTKYGMENYVNKNITNTGSLGLTNSGKVIILSDVKGNKIDSILYKENWHNRNFSVTKNRSIEKINPELEANNASNWSSSVSEEGATPGKSNSIYVEQQIVSSNLYASPSPFSPDEDGYEDFTLIHFNLNQNYAQARIKIFDSKGRMVRTLLNNQTVGNKGEIVFDGRDDEGNILRVGIYIIYLEAINSASGYSENMKSVVVIAQKF